MNRRNFLGRLLSASAVTIATPSVLTKSVEVAASQAKIADRFINTMLCTRHGYSISGIVLSTDLFQYNYDCLKPNKRLMDKIESKLVNDEAVPLFDTMSTEKMGNALKAQIDEYNPDRLMVVLFEPESPEELKKQERERYLRRCRVL